MIITNTFQKVLRTYSQDNDQTSIRILLCINSGIYLVFFLINRLYRLPTRLFEIRNKNVKNVNI